MLTSNQTGKQKRVFVAMSGGVDSSVAAFLLKKKGYQVIGGFIKGYNVDGCLEKDAQDARRVAGFLGIPFYIFDLEKEYKEKVVEYMIDGYKKGITPNPDVMCNKEIKFGLFLKKALELGADYVATGHYVRLKSTNSESLRTFIRKLVPIRCSLMIAKDENKDQSYFLWTLTQDQLKYCLFPIGDYLKSEVRKIARKAGLPTAEKKDSQGICFLGQVNIKNFLSQYLPFKEGDILDTEGKKIGEHHGAYFYTIGQRHLGTKFQIPNGGQAKQGRMVAGLGPKFQKPFYVANKNVESNTLVVAEGDSNPALYRKEIELTDVNFISPQYSNILENVGMSVLARVRYRQPLARAQLIKEPIKKFKLIFETPQKFVASGQSAVFYRPAQSSITSRTTSSDFGPSIHSGSKSSDFGHSIHSGSKSSDFEMLGGGIIV
ncbi:tRNA 2-thiouridine(34) synthase MnmA [Candidatus Jorgensenbacteria bacterium CG_4_8_14_3_um_filter_38_10]|nr:MAG: tRNA 2-thiouridine(34) synthase MnmA [Candidatus Jorgensenbacteria bacterium CG_4_8_14_3_um_filter_38_10]